MTRFDHWDRRFLGMAEHIAGWSRDPSTGVGCVIVDPRHRIVGVGFNGFPAGVNDSQERLNNRDVKLLITQHAERNALAFSTQDVAGCAAYTGPLPPCAQCAGALIQAGITRVVSCSPSESMDRWARDFSLAKEMYQEAGVRVDFE